MVSVGDEKITEQITITLDDIKMLRVIVFRLLAYLEDKNTRYFLPMDNDQSKTEIKTLGDTLLKIEAEIEAEAELKPLHESEK